MTETTQEQVSQEQTTLGLNDLALMANIIQITSQRGAIKAEEMETVGALYKKLAEFVNANTPAADTSDEEEIKEDQ